LWQGLIPIPQEKGERNSSVNGEKKNNSPNRSAYDFETILKGREGQHGRKKGGVKDLRRTSPILGRYLWKRRSPGWCTITIGGLVLREKKGALVTSQKDDISPEKR